MTTIRLELGIDAQRFIQMVQLQHGSVEEQIAKGIELALNDLCEGDNFVQLVRETTKTELSKIVNRAVCSREIHDRIEDVISEKIGQRIVAYANIVAERVTASLAKLDS